MKKIRTIVALSVVAVVMTLAACGSSSNKIAEAKALLQIGFDTFIAEMQQVDPSWNSAGLAKLFNDTLSAWGVGVGWQQNVISELSAIQSDSSLLPKCGAKCSGQLDVFIGGVESVIIILEGTQSSTPAGAMAFAGKPAPKYSSVKAYKKAWNKVATHKIK